MAAAVTPDEALAVIDAGPPTNLADRGSYVVGLRPRVRAWDLPDGRVDSPRWDESAGRFVGERDGAPWSSPWTADLMPAIAGQVFGWCTDEQGWQLHRLAAETADAAAHVEVGTALGLSAVWIGWGSRSSGGPKLLCVDTFQGPAGRWGKNVQEAWQANVDYAGLHDHCQPWASDSRAAGRAYAGPRVGLLYIDAMHSYAACRGDFKAWAPHLRDGAIVAFDDCLARYPGILRFQRELLAWPHAELLGRVDAMLYWRVRW